MHINKSDRQQIQIVGSVLFTKDRFAAWLLFSFRGPRDTHWPTSIDVYRTTLYPPKKCLFLFVAQQSYEAPLSLKIQIQTWIHLYICENLNNYSKFTMNIHIPVTIIHHVN